MSRGRKSILPEVISLPLAKRMRECRMEHNLTLEEVGKRLGERPGARRKARQTLSNIERGVESASYEIVDGYQRIFQITDDELITLWKQERENAHESSLGERPNTRVTQVQAEDANDLALGSIHTWLTTLGIADVWSGFLAMLHIPPHDPKATQEAPYGAIDIEQGARDDFVRGPARINSETSAKFAPLGDSQVVYELQQRRDSRFWDLVDEFLEITVGITIENGNLSANDSFSATQAAMTRSRERIAEFHGTNLRIWLVGIVATESYALNQRNDETNRSLGEMRAAMKEASLEARSSEVVGQALYDFCQRYQDPHRTALILSLGLYKGYKSHEIASSLHMPLARVRQIVSDANRRLQASIRSIERTSEG